ncbi:MAG: sporulation protein YqfD, partial [Lachnospiraceae bacterium]|nr:sporulation protein YqfD [Lachnospiraceae bacterium]
FYLPLVLIKTTLREYTLIPSVRTKEEAELAARQLLVRYLEEKKRGGAVILEKQVAARFTKTKCVFEGQLIFNESAWEYRRIKQEEWRFDSEDEYNTDSN